jgi:molybdopterin-guanine dinucleotide biosynthesis protein A
VQRQAIILAGGLGSRLGPITAQRSKALVTIGQRPHLIHQLLLVRDANAVETVVVVSPDTQRQVVDVVRRAGFTTDEVKFVVQPEPLGPVNALLLGLDALTDVDCMSGVYVIMSDSFVDEPLATEPYGDGDWVGVAPAPTARPFCYVTPEDIYVDDHVDAGELVTIGVNYLASRDDAYRCAAQVANYGRAKTFGEIPMSQFFNAYTDLRGPVIQRVMKSWLDVGDVNALARAHRSRFISRSHHTLEFDNVAGIIVKYGEGEAFERQLPWLLERGDSSNHRTANLLPRVYDSVTWPDARGWYAMEYVDLPTLAELWLYWPGRPDVWKSLLANVINQVGMNLWTGGGEDEPTANVLWFVDKTRDRVNMRGLPEWHAVAEPLLDLAEDYLRDVHSGLVRGHGDLNFSNILYSLNTGMIKLIDPRGDHFVPFLYELAKLRYSYHGGFAAITHGLASLAGERVTLWPRREAEVTALDEVLAEWVPLDVLTVCEGCLLVAGAPLHDGVESEMLFWRGIELLREVLTRE